MENAMNDITTTVLLLDDTIAPTHQVDPASLAIAISLLIGYVLYGIFVVGRRK
jgi:hypothetical protein